MDSKRRHTMFTVLLAAITSATTLTVVHKCVMVDTLKLRTTSSVQKIAQATHGAVIASAEVVLPRRDTVVVHDTVLTTRVVTRWDTQRVTGELGAGTPSGMSSMAALPGIARVPVVGITRIARFRDSTFAGIINGVITAPPDSGPIGITYQVIRPAFTPTIAFIQTSGQPLVVVSWRGERVELDHVVFHPNGSRWIRYVEAGYSPVARSVAIGGTLGMRVVAGMGVVATVTQPIVVGAGPAVIVSVRREL
jgi:hypothetical protein